MIGILLVILQSIHQVVVTGRMLTKGSRDETDFSITVVINVSNLRESEFACVCNLLGANDGLVVDIPYI